MNQEKKQSKQRGNSKETYSNRSLWVTSLEDSLIHKISTALHWIEVGLAGISIIFVIIGIGYLFGELLHFWDHLSNTSLHLAFEDVLSDILLLVVGVELAIMLVRRTPESLIEVMFFVIARKTLIKTDQFYELLIGVAALAGLFAIRKYLQCNPQEESSDE